MKAYLSVQRQTSIIGCVQVPPGTVALLVNNQEQELQYWAVVNGTFFGRSGRFWSVISGSWVGQQ